MWLHGRGGAPFLMIFEFSLMHLAHLITASNQFISYRSMYTNFTSLSLIHPVAPGALLYRSGWSAARGVRRRESDSDSSLPILISTNCSIICIHVIL